MNTALHLFADSTVHISETSERLDSHEHILKALEAADLMPSEDAFLIFGGIDAQQQGE